MASPPLVAGNGRRTGLSRPSAQAESLCYKMPTTQADSLRYKRVTASAAGRSPSTPPLVAGNDASPEVSPGGGQTGCRIWLALFPTGETPKMWVITTRLTLKQYKKGRYNLFDP